MSEQDTGFSFVNAEQNVLKYWEEKDIFKKSLEKNPKSNPYIFYDGPPFATGLPHHGHIVGQTLKDIVPRFFTMKGFYVERRFGWDCHGLPIEQEIDKKLKMSALDAVAKYGLKKYCDECRSIVQRYTSEWEKTIRRIGRWVDFENDYKTMDPSFMESVWWVFKELWEKKLIYQGEKVVPFSTALGTVLSNFEASLNYQDVQDPAVTVLFKVKNEENTYIAAWTTTPWTLPSNLGLCMRADLEYVKVKDNEKNIFLIMAKDCLKNYEKKHNLEVISEHLGKDFLGTEYEPLFNYFENLSSKGAFRVLNDDYVSADATGVVHLAPGFGEDDFRVCKENGVNAVVCPIDFAGKFTSEITEFQGKYVKEADKELIKKLKEEKKVYEQSVLVHSYPYCWRSDTPLIYRTIPSWFVDVEKIKENLIASNQEINWVPDHIKDGRFGKWLEGARDWSISRNRYWGCPLPVWYNETSKQYKCIGSVEELKNLSGIEVDDLHREFVDPIEFEIDGEEGKYKRIPEVLDCWFESGSMPYAQLHYPFENQETFKKGFPAAFIAEGLDQTRGWFYTLNILSTALYQKPAFKNVIVNGLVMAEDGKKMSKSLKNYTEPDIIMENYGADAFRLYLINSALVKGDNLRFKDEGVKDMVRRVLLPWYNAFKFFQTYASVDNFDVSKNQEYGDNITDKWVISKQQSLIKNVTIEMENYRLYNVVPNLFGFIDDLTNWYIRLNRRRFWEEGLTSDKCQAFTTLFDALLNLTTMMAPFAPFLSEHIYLELQKFNKDNLKSESVHLQSFPEPRQDLINPVLEEAVIRIQEIILLGRQKRNQTQIKVKTPLQSITIVHSDESLLNEIKKLETYILSELNIKKANYSTKEEDYIDLNCKPNSPVLGPKLGKEFGKYRKLFLELTNQQLLQVESGQNIEIEGKSFSQEDLLIERNPKTGSNSLSNRFITIDIDCHLTDDLILEGLAREVVNRIQKTRKDKNFNVTDRIDVSFNSNEVISKSIKQFAEYIQKETLCDKLIEMQDLTEFETHQIDDNELKLHVIKV